MIIEPYAKRPIIQRAEKLKAADLYTFFRPISFSDGRRVEVRGKKQVMIGSNNYLGLTHHPYVIEKTKEALDRYGTGCTGSRFLNGTLDLHEELEERIARFVGHEKAIVCSTGMQTNLGSIPAIAGPRDVIFSDGENHASIIDACKLSQGTVFKYKHNNMSNLEELLVEHRDKYQNAVIIVDGVFSMTGDIVKLPEIVKLANKYRVQVYVDDAHGFGVLGDRGDGTMNHFGLKDEVDFMMGTFSKSFASIGGFISGTKDAIDYVQYTSRTFIFSAAMPPSATATVLACIDLLEKDNSLVKKLERNAEFISKGLRDLGFYTYGSKTPIIPILVGDDMVALKVARVLEDMGIFATAVLAPAVPKGEALIRTSYMATHEVEELQFVLDVFAELKKQFPFPAEHPQGH